MTQRTQDVTVDSWFFNDGSTNYGNGQGTRMYVGHTAFGSLTGKNRFGIKIPRGSLFNGIPSAGSISAFNIKLRVKSGCAGLGGSVRFFVERATTALGENTDSNDCEVNTNGSDKSKKWPGPDRASSNRASFSGSPSADQWISVNALALGREWFAHPEWDSLILVGVAANDALDDYDEDTSSRRVAFYTAQSGSHPYAEITFGSNTPPNKPGPLIVSPGTDGMSFTLTAPYWDDDGDTSTKYEAVFTPDPEAQELS